MTEVEKGENAHLRHIPNMVTVGRAVLALPYFVLLALAPRLLAKGGATGFAVMRISAGLFIVSMVFDVVDGWLARRWQAESVLGRILDPVLDKVVICGSLVFCIGVSRGLLTPWMVVVVLARELSVSALRSYIESRGVDFKARASGKVKTASQCAAIGAILIYAGMASDPAWARTTTGTAVWFMLLMVVLSGADYLLRACRIISGLADETRP